MKLISVFASITSNCFNLHIRTRNRAILVSTEIPMNLESFHANEGAIKGHPTSGMITCLLRLHDDFPGFS